VEVFERTDLELGLDNIQHTTYNKGMIRTQVYIPDDLYSQAQLIAQVRGVNFSAILRRGLEKEVGEARKIKKGRLFANLAGALKYGPKDLSTRVNDIYK